MKKKDIEQLKNKPVAELKKLLGERKEKLWQLRRDLTVGKVKNIREIRKIRKSIARILTFIGKNE